MMALGTRAGLGQMRWLHAPLILISDAWGSPRSALPPSSSTSPHLRSVSPPPPSRSGVQSRPAFNWGCPIWWPISVTIWCPMPSTMHAVSHGLLCRAGNGSRRRKRRMGSVLLSCFPILPGQTIVPDFG